MAEIDIFHDDAFSAVELSDTVSRMPYVPGRIGEMGIFQTDGIRTTSLAVEEKNGTIGLIPYSDRDGDENHYNGGKRRMLSFETGHFPLSRIIRPNEIQNIRAFGSETELQSAQNVVDEKMQEMVPYHDITLEFQRLGALKGLLLDSDGTTVIENLYDRFGITQPEQDFALTDDTTDVRVKCLQVLRMIDLGLGSAIYKGVVGLCGSDFFDDFVSHPSVRRAYERWQNGEFLRSDPRYSGFYFGGIMWEEYRGQVNGSAFIAAGEAQIFPVGVPDMFVTRFAPANMVQFANQKGLPRYASIELLKHGRGVDVLTESDPISLNKRPGASIKGTA